MYTIVHCPSHVSQEGEFGQRMRKPGKDYLDGHFRFLKENNFKKSLGFLVKGKDA